MTGGEPASFPTLPKARVTAVALNTRSRPGVGNPIIGLLQNGAIFEVFSISEQGNDAWLKIG